MCINYIKTVSRYDLLFCCIFHLSSFFPRRTTKLDDVDIILGFFYVDPSPPPTRVNNVSSAPFSPARAWRSNSRSLLTVELIYFGWTEWWKLGETVENGKNRTQKNCQLESKYTIDTVRKQGKQNYIRHEVRRGLGVTISLIVVLTISVSTFRAPEYTCHHDGPIQNWSPQLT